jgi:tRNA-dihydrouridine synthase
MIKERENNMQLLKEKLKTKKYQYLYLKEKLDLKIQYYDHWIDTTGMGSEILSEEKRFKHLEKWLEKINNKYNYA